MSDQTMHTTVRVDSAADTSGIDKMLARVNRLQASVARMAKTPAMGLSAGIEASVRKARDLGSVLAKNDSESAANLKRRLGMERRIWSQSAREAEKTAKIEAAASSRVTKSKLLDAKILDRAMRRDEDARFADGARALRAKVLGVKLAALAESKASEDAAKRAESALVKRFAFEDRMRRQRTREEASAARETASAHREAARVEARTLADRERARAAETRRRAASWGDVRQGGQNTLTRARETYSGASQIGRQVLVGTGAAVAAGIKGIAGRMAVDAAETSLKIFGDDGGKKFTSNRIAEIRREWLDNTALDTGNTSADAIKAYTELNKSGIKNPKENTELLLKAQAGLELNTGGTAKLMGLVDRNLGAASTPKRMKSVLNAIGVAAREDPTSSPEIVEGMRRGFGALSLGNMSPEHLAGLVSGAQSVGVQPGKAGTFIATLMKDLTAGSYARGQRGKDLNEAARMLGFGSARNMANSAATDSTNTILHVLERLEAMPELQRSKATNRLSNTQWSDEDLMLLQGLGGLKKTLAEIDSPKNNNFLEDASNERMNSWEKQWDRSKAIFSRFWEAIGTGFDGIFNEVNRYFYDSAKRYDWSRVTTNVKSFLEGFVNGLGFKDVRSILEAAFGKPGDQNASMVEQWKAFGRGLATGLKSIFDAVRSLMSAFTGKSADPEAIGRFTGKVIALSAALLILAPVVSVLGTLAAGIGLVAAALRAGKGVLDLVTKTPGGRPPVPVPEGTGPAAKGVASSLKGAVKGVLGSGATILSLPIDPSKEDKDKLMKRLGGWALEQEKAAQERTRTWVEPPAKVQKQSAVDEDARRYIRPASLSGNDVARGVERVAHAVESMGARVQLASLAGSLSGSLAGGGALRSSIGGAVTGAAGLDEIRGAGGTTAILGAIPGQALPGQSLRSREFTEDGSSTASRFSGRRFNPDGTDPNSTAPRFGGRGVIDPLMSRDVAARAKVAHDFFRSKGLSEEATAGILASMKKESNFTPNARGDGGRAHGLFQHHADRRAAIERATGINMSSASFEQQLEGAWWEMNNGDKGAQRALRILRTPGISARDAGGAFVQHFERPARDERGERGALAEGFAREFDGSSGTVASSNSPATGAAGTAADNAAKLLGAGSSQAAAALGSRMTPGQWCADFVNGSLKSANIKGVNSSIANSFMGWGNQVLDGVKKGDVVVEHRGRRVGQPGGHVGLATGRVKYDERTGRTFAETISGNHGNRVGQSWVDIGKAMVRRSEQTLAGKPGAYGKPQDIGDGMTSTGWKRAGAEELAADSPAQKLARSAPKMPGGSAATGGGTKVHAPIQILSNGDAQHTANQVQKRIQDASSYHAQDLSYESI